MTLLERKVKIINLSFKNFEEEIRHNRFLSCQNFNMVRRVNLIRPVFMLLKKHMTRDQLIFYAAGVTGRVIFCHSCVWLEEVFVLVMNSVAFYSHFCEEIFIFFFVYRSTENFIGGAFPSFEELFFFFGLKEELNPHFNS